MRHPSDVPHAALLPSGLLGLLVGLVAGPVAGVLAAVIVIALPARSSLQPVPLPVRVRRRESARRRV
ncbi:MAG TPA: hypothetical protein VHF00_04105 [Acidimicrobiales bacterium]|nr:hypothetical protein [Acidimicrobiales bacterium]